MIIIIFISVYLKKFLKIRSSLNDVTVGNVKLYLAAMLTNKKYV